MKLKLIIYFGFCMLSLIFNVVNAFEMNCLSDKSLELNTSFTRVQRQAPSPGIVTSGSTCTCIPSNSGCQPTAPAPAGPPVSPGMPSPGIPSPGVPSPGMPSPGMPSPGMPSPGMPSPGIPSPGFPSSAVTTFDTRIVNNGAPSPGVIPTSAPVPPPMPPPIPAPTSTSLRCQGYTYTCCQPGPYRCGITYPPPPNSRPAGPGQAPFGAYPWQVILLNSYDIPFGSGALIDSRHVITAAHKIFAYQTPLVNKIRIGDWDLSRRNDGIPHQTRRILRVFIHPWYVSTSLSLENDIAVARLETPVDLFVTPTIATVCLPYMQYMNILCYVAGWGQNEFTVSGSFYGVQKHVDVFLKSATQCQTELRTRLGPNYIFPANSFVCAGGEAGKDACLGDGGAPLVCKVDNRWIVVGLVAWGIGCGTAGVPGVYVNVFSFVGWINSVIVTP